MKFLPSFMLVLTWVFICLDVARAIDCNLDSINTITVDLSGRGNFSKVQDAVDFIPKRNTQWFRISVNPGKYREQVKIPADKPCILLEGQSQETTSIEFDAHQATDQSATFTVEADNFVAKQISFKNTYNMQESSHQTQAVAARIKGDKSSFYNCGFYSVQDTVWDDEGRHLFSNCKIQGAVDFIWGNGQSIYKDCEIIVAGLRSKRDGYITAQGRASESETTGFMFKGGRVTGNSLAYLGRAYKAYSRVIFHGTMLSQVVLPLGWNAWKFVGGEGNFVYAESDCSGPGSDTSQRVPWEKKLSQGEVHRFTDISFIDSDGWLSKQPN